MTWTKTFHRIWFDEPERPEFAAWRDKLAELHPDWQIRTWDRSDEVRDLIDGQPLKNAWDRYMASDPFGRIPDIARYLLLWNHGGVYIDTDFEPLKPMDELLDDPRPFAAWENDRTMCTALLASPSHHAAIGVLLDGLVQRLEETEGQTANNAVGPEYATAIWREREDVRRLPPATFYPVGWWEKNLLGKVDYPPETYAVHHWAKGWGKKVAKPKRRSDAKVSFLIPFRDVDGERTKLLDVVTSHIERHFPDAEIVIATDDGIDPFHKTLALNRAATDASGDVFVVFDADTWVSTQMMERAISLVTPSVWVRPYNTKIKLNQEATDAVIAGTDIEDLDVGSFGRPEATTGFRHAPPLMIHRDSWFFVGGMDERFQGWGSEDTALSLTLDRLVGPQVMMRGVALHLKHPRIGRAGSDLWRGQESQLANIELLRGYRRAKTPEDFAALREMVTV